jgi:hypothetical protein
MSQPQVSIVELDGALGILPPSAGALYAVVGVSNSGTADTPATFARVKDVVAAFGSGPLVEAGCHYIERYGKPVVFVKTGQTTVGTASTIAIVNPGTSVITRDVAVVPIGDYEFAFRIVTAGTIGSAGITFQWSLDAGRNWSPVTALGTAVVFTVPADASPTGSAAPGIKLAFAAGTMLATTSCSFRTTSPQPNGTEVASALLALGNSIITWEILHLTCILDATVFAALEVKVAAWKAAGKYHPWIANVRPILITGETEAQYKTALDAIFSSLATVDGDICAATVKMISSVSGREYKVPFSYVYAAREASVSHEINVAAIDLGPLPCSIRDANGNNDEHDESINPGLDDSGFTVARTWEGIAGVYVNRPNLFSAAGSDFELLPHRRVINLGHAALRAYFQRRLNKPVRVNATTGFLLESEALEIESGARAAMRSVLLAKPKASAVAFVLSRTDNILSTKTFTGQARVTPLGYPEAINLDVGFQNPAMSVQTA